jgi:hypothetical protein
VELPSVPTPEQFAADPAAKGEVKIIWHGDAPMGVHEFLRVYDQDTGVLVYSGGPVDADGAALAKQGDVNGYLGPGTGNGIACKETSYTDTVSLAFDHSYLAQINYDVCIAIKGGKYTKKASLFCQDNGVNCGDMAYAGVQNSSGVLVAYEFDMKNIPSPKVSLSGSNSVLVGKPLKLTWKADYATSCKASGSWSGTKPVSGNELVTPANENESYTLTCTAGGKTGSATYSNKFGAEKSIGVSGSPNGLQILGFNITKPLNPGDNVTVSWNVQNVSVGQSNTNTVKCSVDNGIGEIPCFGSAVIKFFKTTTITLTASDLSTGQTVSATKTIDVKKIPRFIETAPH